MIINVRGKLEKLNRFIERIIFPLYWASFGALAGGIYVCWFLLENGYIKEVVK